MLKCGILYSPDTTDNLKLVADISNLDLKQEQVEEVFFLIQNYKSRNSTTETYSKLKNVIEALENYCKRSDKKNRLITQIFLKKDDKTPAGDALINEIQGITGKATLRVQKGKYKADKLENIIFLTHKNFSIVGEENVEFESAVEISGQNIEISSITFNSRFAIRKTAKNVKLKNCYFSNTELNLEQSEDISFENCFIRQITVRNGKNITFNHCTLTTVKMAKAVIPLIIEGDSIEINDSIIYGDRFAVVFSNKGSSSKRKFNNSLIFGEEGLIAEKEQLDKIEDKNIIKRPSGLSKYCKVKNGIFVAPQFIDAQNGNWGLVPNTQGTKVAKDGNDIGVIWPLFHTNASLPQINPKN